MNFGIIGQEYIVNSLINCLKDNCLSHSYIFEGPKGIGKRTVAKTFAQLLLCESKGNNPCGKCKSCMLFKAGNHPDVTILSSDKSIGVNTIREMIKDTGIKPYYGGKKIYIILDAENMTVQAQNSLLKTLEEPPEYVVIILTTINLNLLLPTLVSRCILKRFIRNTNEEIKKYILSNYPECSDNLEVLISLSDGIIGKAKQLAESSSFFQLRHETFKIIEKITKGTKLQALETEKFFTQNKDNIDLVLDFMLLWFRDILILRETNKQDLVINSDYKDILLKFAKILNWGVIDNSIKAIFNAKNDLLNNGNFNVTIETMILKISNQGALA